MLQTWAEDGTPLLRLGDRINRRLGSIDVFPGNGPGSITVPAFAEGAPFAITTAIGDGDFDFQARTVTTGTTLSWSWGALGYGEPVATRIIYGVY